MTTKEETIMEKRIYQYIIILATMAILIWIAVKLLVPQGDTIFTAIFG